jgi:hypothetical protein
MSGGRAGSWQDKFIPCSKGTNEEVILVKNLLGLGRVFTDVNTPRVGSVVRQLAAELDKPAH